MEVAPYGHRLNYGAARAPDFQKLLPTSPGSKKYTKKLKQQSTGARRRVGSAGGLQGLTEVTPLALLFVLAGRQRRVAFDGQNALRSIKMLKKQLINNQLLEGDVGEQQEGHFKAH